MVRNQMYCTDCLQNGCNDILNVILSIHNNTVHSRLYKHNTRATYELGQAVTAIYPSYSMWRLFSPLSS